MLTMLATLGVACGGLLLGTDPAGAFVGRATVGSPFGTFSNARGITIDQSTGNIYVVDGGAEEIKIYGPEGSAPVGSGPSSFNGSGSFRKSFNVGGEPSGPAFDAKSHVLYFPDVKNNLIDKYKLEGSEYKFLCEITSGGTSGDACAPEGVSGTTHFDEPLGTAVDSSGDLYIADYGSKKIFEYSAAGVEVASFEGPGGNAPQYMAVTANGTIYVQTYSSHLLYELKRSSQTATTLEGEPTFIRGGVEGVAYDEATGDLEISLGSTVEDVNAKHEIVGGSVAGALSNGGQGLAVNEATDYLSVLNGSSAGIVTFGLGVVLPDVTTDQPEKVGRTTTMICGTINPDGLPETSYWFEYGETSTYETVSPEVEIPGAPNEPIVVCLPISGLTGGTTYHYRLVGKNKNGTNPDGDVSFETALAVEGMKNQEATNVGIEKATFNGSLEPNGTPATCWFKWGTEQYNLTTETAHESAGEGSGEEVFSQTLEGLEPNTSYYYTLTCENSFGTSTASIPFFRSALKTLATAPVVYAESIVGASREHVVLTAEMNPANSLTTYYFEYGETNEYGYRTPVTELSTIIAGHRTAEALASELKPDSVYHFRVVAENSVGTAVGADMEFTSGSLTPPLTSTGAATNIAPSEATIEGLVNTEGLITIYGFEIGTEEGNLGPQTGQGSIGAGFSEATAKLELHGLKPSELYYYRIVATNVDGEDVGAIRSFTTTAYPNPNIVVRQLRVLTEPFVEWPSGSTANTAEEPKPTATKCKRGYVKKSRKCVKKKAKKRGKAKKGKGKKGKGQKGKANGSK